MKRDIEEIEEELDELQIAYINEDDEIKQIEIVRKFTHRLIEATDTDQIERVSAGVTIHNWFRSSASKMEN
jgi:hypothetical protein